MSDHLLPKYLMMFESYEKARSVQKGREGNETGPPGRHPSKKVIQPTPDVLAPAACYVTLRHGTAGTRLDLESELWRALADAVKKGAMWEVKTDGKTVFTR
jgi:hypothetical protein